MSTHRRPFFALAVNWCIVALVLVASYIVCYRIPLSGLAPNPGLSQLHHVSRSIAMLLLVLSCLSAVLVVVVSIACMRDRAVPVKYVAWVAFACMTPFIGYVVVSLATWPMHRAALVDVVRRAQPLVAAIDRYTAEVGEPPESLASLTPKYLTSIPETGLSAYPAFNYARFSTKTARRTLWWYDLGSRHGRTVTTNWVYPDGDTAHAILALELDGEDRVVLARPDRLAVEPSIESFTRAAWDKKPVDRQGVIADLQRRFPLEGRSAGDVRQLIGAPDGIRVLVSSPWELWLHTWPTENERFFYWPTHAYPTVLDSRSVMAVDSWAYARD